MQLSRGYTRCAEYLLDSDDDAPMPKPRPAVPARLLGGTSLLPPPKKQVRVSAASAPMRNGIEKAIPANSPQCHHKPMPPHHQIARLPVHRTVHELVAPPAPAVSAQPTPSKGCNKYFCGRRDHENKGTPWPKPKISNGYDHVGDREPWRSIAVAQYPKKPWPLGARCDRPPPPC